MKIDLKEVDKAFDAMLFINKERPKEWEKSILSSLKTSDGINELRNMAKLRAIVVNFVEDQNIFCAETIYQTDRVIQNAYEFIQELVEVVGYKKDEDDGDNE